MSSKREGRGQKREPDIITIDTTVLKINVKSTGDLITKDYDLIPFHPNMADLRDLSNNSYILFPSFIKITMKDLKKAGVGEDYPKVFMNLDKYIKLIKYVTGPEREEDFTLIIDKSQVKNYTVSLAQNALADLMAEEVTDVISIQKYEPLTEEEIIVNNVELIKSLFLPVKSHFFILGNEYVIGQSKYVPPYTASVEKNEKLSEVKKIPLAYTVTFELQLLDAANNPDVGDFSKMSCKAKKNMIAKDTKDIFGMNFGYEPEQKVAIASILNTSKVTENRQFSKLQKEWEERNKYVKEPANERERIALEKTWTPIQRKMAEYDKNQAEFNKIPPLWLKENKELAVKYDEFKSEMVKLWQEMADIKKSNEKNQGSTFVRDMLEGVKKKMEIAANQFVLTEKKEPRSAEANKAIVNGLKMEDITLPDMLSKFKEYTELNAPADPAEKKPENELNILAEQIVNLKDLNDLIKSLETIEAAATAESTITASAFYKNAKIAAEKSIDMKYVEPLLEGTGLEEKEKDLIALERQEAELIAKINTLSFSENPGDKYNIESVKNELAKAQAEKRKKQTDIAMLKEKFNVGEIVKIWKIARDKMGELSRIVESEKTKEEKKISQETVREELKKKKKEIDELKKELLVATFKENGEDTYLTVLTKKEKESYDKKEKPLDNAANILTNLKTAKEQYMEIYGKLGGFYYKIQAEITLLGDDFSRLKDLKTAKEDEKKVKDEKLRKIGAELKNLHDAGRKGATAGEKSERELSLEKEQDELQEDVNKITSDLENIKKQKDAYEKYINILKSIPETDAAAKLKIKLEDPTTYSDKFKKEDISKVLTKALNPSIAGGSFEAGGSFGIYISKAIRANSSRKYKSKNKSKSKSKRHLRKSKKTLRHLKKYIHKKKRTWRRRYT
jgi:hypothetical protein